MVLLYRAAALSALLANLTLLLRKNALPLPARQFIFVSPPHRRAYTSLSRLCPEKTFPHQQDFFPIASVTKSSTDENLVEKFKIFVQDFVPIRTALRQGFFLPFGNRHFSMGKNDSVRNGLLPYGGIFLALGGFSFWTVTTSAEAVKPKDGGNVFLAVMSYGGNFTALKDFLFFLR